jgi:hypothetical protein
MTNEWILKLAGAFHGLKTSRIRFCAFSYSMGDPCGRSFQVIMYCIQLTSSFIGARVAGLVVSKVYARRHNRVERYGEECQAQRGNSTGCRSEPADYEESLSLSSPGLASNRFAGISCSHDQTWWHDISSITGVLKIQAGDPARTGPLAKQPAEKLGFVSGPDFSRAVKD